MRTAASGGSCGLEVEDGRVYVVVARSTPTGLTGGLCDGTRPLTTVTASDLDAVAAALVGRRRRSGTEAPADPLR